jgi:RHS repeat-associated protein
MLGSTRVKSAANGSFMSSIACVTILSLWLATVSLAQDNAGSIPFSTVAKDQYDTINLSNLNILLDVPVRQKTGAIPFNYKLTGSFQVYKACPTCQFPSWGVQGGVFGATDTDFFPTLQIHHTSGAPPCPVSDTNWTFLDHLFTTHLFCVSSSSPTAAAYDQSGYTIDTFNSPSPAVYNLLGYKIAGGSVTDTNGNSLTGSGFTSIKDTLGTTAVTITGLGGTSPTYSYTDATGKSQGVTTIKTPSTVQTAFHCSGVAEYSATGYGLLSQITLPDGTKFGFTYEPSVSGAFSGRLTSITLPTGGTISYQYSGGTNGINCADGTPATMKRITPDGTWIYTHTVNGTQSTTTVTDPAGNDTVYSFSGVYETQREIYQGSSTKSGNTPLLIQTTCYNANFANCATAAVTPPITQKDVYRTPSGGANALSETSYDAYGQVTQDNEYDYGINTGSAPTASPLQATKTVFANINNFIQNRPACVQVTAGSSPSSCGTVTANTKSLTNYLGYDTHGNVGTIQKWVSGSTYLSTSISYNTNGTIASITDVNGAVTHYYFNGTGQCNGLLQTSATFPVNGLSKSETWDCNGGVVTTSTDQNHQETTYGYVNQQGNADPFWRVQSATDPLLNTSWNSYSPATQTKGATFETSLTFNNNASTSDSFYTADQLGRVSLAQKRVAPGSSSFDNAVQYAYGWNGSGSVTGPFVTQTVPGGSGITTTQKDALGRTASVTDGGGGTTTFAYVKNDALRIVGPAPTQGNEHTKQRQTEYDALGRITSVCEITSTLAGKGTCSQASSSPTGYFTKYIYDSPANAVSVTQNAQGTPQTRSYQYDGLGRLTSESNPEMLGVAVTYTLDSDATCGTYHGDRVKKVDAMGNVICFAYDQLHRIAGVTYPSGPYASSTPNKCFVYDADIDSQLVTNSGGYLAEAYTTSSACSSTQLPTIKTDEAYGYSKRGELTDVYEKTPNSGGYYHTTATFWANGSLNTLGGVPGLNSWTYGVDGEGRANSTTSGVSTSLVSSTTYNGSSQTTTVSYGNGDSDGYTFDPSTARMTGYRFTVGSAPQSVVGTLGWNANGSLGSLAITDPLNATNVQTCSYAHDDLARVSSANCVNGATNVFSQNYTLDAFGNITKSGSGSSFPVSYLLGNGTTNNREQVVGSCVPTYDANGNLTKDCANNSVYTWDANANPTSLISATLTYDALDREVEVTVGSSTTQILFGPVSKIGIMNGRTPITISIPLPGASTGEILGATGGTTHILHADWLGSSRVSTNFATRTMAYDVSYAPYGENYSGAGPSSTDLSFTNQYQDTAPGLYDFRYRRYSPVHGRWHSPDPAGTGVLDFGNPQSFNRYVYVQNNPLASIDPNGLDCVYVGEYNEQGASGWGAAKYIADHDSTEGECDANGGYWAPGYVANSGAIGIDPNSDNIVIVSSVDGATDVSVAGVGPGGWGAYTWTALVLPNSASSLVFSSDTLLAEVRQEQAQQQHRGEDVYADRIRAFGSALDHTHVQSINNICTPAGFYLETFWAAAEPKTWGAQAGAEYVGLFGSAANKVKAVCSKYGN